MARRSNSADAVTPRRGQPGTELGRGEFDARFRAQFRDPAFAASEREIAHLAEIAWGAYSDYRKAPLVRRAGRGFQDPDYGLSDEWRATSEAIRQAQRRQGDPASPGRILLVCASPRSEHTCPGEMSKSYRLLEALRAVVTGSGFECDVLELNRLTSEYGRVIHPCKGCVSTAMPLCHWPCSCYPNYALGQTSDWMNEIYPRWVAAHGVIVVTPVHWEQAPSVLKLMMDRLVCADGGNPDPTSTGGKDARRAKRLELDGWDYPQHLAGRIFGLVVHGDTEGVQTLRRSLADWLHGMGLVDAGRASLLDRYLGYYQPYATSHAALDADSALMEETRNVARAVVRRVSRLRAGPVDAERPLRSPRVK